MKTVCVMGLGYMGLPLACLLAQTYRVYGVDINPERVAAVNVGQCPFNEHRLPELLAQAHASGSLSAHAAPHVANAFVISVPTPVDHNSNRPDMSHVVAAVSAITPHLQPGNLVVLESTSPVGSVEHYVQNAIETNRPELQGKILYAFCPERAIPGNTLHELVHNDRIIGGLTPAATAKTKELFQSFVKGQLLETTAPVAEMVKLVENASRDVQIAFANELSLLCDRMGLDVWDVIRLANYHPRVNILQPGAGVGGHCIAVDPWFMIHDNEDITPLMQAARRVNDYKPAWVATRVQHVAQQFTNPTISLLGLAYKPDVDDCRESPALSVFATLQHLAIGTVQVHDPFVPYYDGIPMVDLPTALAADILVLTTAHQQFKNLDYQGKTVVDPLGLTRQQ